MKPARPRRRLRLGDEPGDWKSGHRELEESDHLVSVGILAGGIAHQVNNALTSMRLSLGRLVSFELSRRPMSAERLHRVELLQDVREGVSRIERIIRELKAFSHVEDEPAGMVSVTAQLELALELVAHEIKHRARLIRGYADVPSVFARPDELRRVFVHLLLNAAHAMSEGEAHINELRVTTRTDEHGRAIVELADTGSGIAPEVAGRVFEPFFTTSPDEGLGLGLAISRDVIASLDGEITIDSVAGKGTTVRVALPPSNVFQRAGASEPAGVSKATMPRRILIIDDDRPVAAAIAFELEAHDVVVAESGREALEILRREKDFDLILCDLMMPEVTGMDVYESIRLLDPALLQRVVLMTGGAFTSRAREFLSKVSASVIEKPFQTGELLAIVDATTARREPREDSAGGERGPSGTSAGTAAGKDLDD